MNAHSPNSYFVWQDSEKNNANCQRLDLKHKVFVNPNFGKNIHVNKIHINPNGGMGCDKFLQNQVILNSCQNNIPTDPLQGIKIHINPMKKNVLIPQNIHVNPKFRPQIDFQTRINPPILEKKPAIIITKTKLVRAPHTPTVTKHPKRRSSVKSKFKIVHNTSHTPKNSHNDKITRFKVDHRRTKSFNLRNKQYKIVNTKLRRLNEASSQMIKKNKSIKNVQSSLSLVKINGVMYKKTNNSLRKMAMCKINTKKSSSIVMRSKYKIVKKAQCKKDENIMRQKYSNVNKKIKIISPSKPKMMMSKKKLKICNIPCPFYRKYGICRGKDNGKCFRKHDPAQVALCTRFLQGACLKEKCLLSHQVSSEKMPTCKFYLEGSCIKENCPYLHVKLSQNSEICRDFLEGFCKEAAECKRRHQYLCPEFEKYGSCPKQRCPYPHGNMVRSFLIHKNKFTKNYSNKKKLTNTDNVIRNKESRDKNEEKQRYYEKHNSIESTIPLKNSDSENENMGLQSRPKLGNLPSFIPFNE